MTTTHQIIHCGDLYEIVLHGHIIASIVCYVSGSQRRQDVKYDNLSEDLQDKILQKVVEKMRQENN